MRFTFQLFSLLLCLSCFGQPAPINRRAMAITSLATSPFYVTNLPGLVMWISATNLLNNSGNPASVGDSIKTFKDQSGLGNDLVKDNVVWPAGYPVLSGGGPNGSNYVRFYAPSAAMGVFTNQPNGLPIPVTLIGVYSVSNNVFSPQSPFSGGTDSGPIWGNKVSDLAFYAGRPDTVPNPAPQYIPRTWYIVTVTETASTAAIYTNNVLYYSTNITSANITNKYVMFGQAGVEYFEGGFCEAILCTNLLSSADQAATVNYLKNKYGIPVNNLIEGLALWLKYDDGSGTNPKDSGQSGFTTIYTTNSPVWTNGHIGSGALHFAVNQYTKGSVVPVSGVPMTITAWVKLDSTTLANTVQESICAEVKLSALDLFSCSYYRLDSTGGASMSMFAQDSTAANSRRGYYNLTLDTSWHHLAFVFNSMTSFSMYLDGSPVTVSYTTGGSGSPTVSVDSVFNGGFYVLTSTFVGPMNGAIDDCRIYNWALTSGDVQTVYNYAP